MTRKSKTISVGSPEELRQRIPQFIDDIGDHKIITFSGDLGAGKTTLIKMLCEAWNVLDLVTSPTFSIANVYKTQGGDVVNHLDLYRLDNLDQAIDVGIEEYLFDPHLTLIEWPALITDLLPDHCAFIITQTEKGLRKIVFLESHISQ